MGKRQRKKQKKEEERRQKEEQERLDKKRREWNWEREWERVHQEKERIGTICEYDNYPMPPLPEKECFKSKLE